MPDFPKEVFFFGLDDLFTYFLVKSDEYEERGEGLVAEGLRWMGRMKVRPFLGTKCGNSVFFRMSFIADQSTRVCSDVPSEVLDAMGGEGRNFVSFENYDTAVLTCAREAGKLLARGELDGQK